MRSIIPLFFVLVFSPRICLSSGAADPVPRPWPEQFHALMYTNFTDTGKLVVDDHWYDHPNGRDLNMNQRQLSDVLYGLDWDNGTSFYYTLGAGGTCSRIEYPVGVLRPDFLSDATYLGRVSTDGFLCDLWQKLDFIWYYEDVATRRPVRWDFYNGMSTHAMTFEVGAVLPDSSWQAPAYCFPESGAQEDAAAGTPSTAPMSAMAMFRQLSLLSSDDAPSHLSQTPKSGKIRDARI